MTGEAPPGADATGRAPTTGQLGMLRRQLLLTLNTTLAKFGRAGLDVEATAIKALPDDTTLTVAVVGETQRGKTSLVNTLAGLPGLVPIGSPVLSGAYVRVLQGDDQVARVLAEGGEQRLTLPEFQAAATDRASQLPAVGVHLQVPHALGPVTLLDTPGVGEVGGSRLELCLRLAERGGLLLFLVDAGSPIARTEVSLLEQCADRVEQVVVVVTMTDKYPQTAQAIAQHVHLQLAPNPRLRRLPVVAVSSVLADASARLPEGPQRDAVLAASGLPALRRHITDLEGRAQLLSVANRIRGCRRVLGDRIAAAQLASAAASSEDEKATVIEDIQDQLALLTVVKGRWNLDLDRDLNRIRRDVPAEIGRRMTAFEHEGRDKLQRLPVLRSAEGFLATFETDMAASLAVLVDDITQLLTTDLGEVMERLGETVDIERDRQPVATAAPAALSMQHALNQPVRPDTVAGLAIGALQGGSMAQRMFGWQMAVPGAIAYMVIQRFSSGKRVNVSEATQALREECGRLRSELVAGVHEYLDEVRPELIVEFRDALNRREADLKNALREAHEARRADAAARAAQSEKLKAVVAELRAWQRQLDDALALVHD